MAEKSIKISIKTALDAAGIQATNTQLDQMAEHIKGVSSSMRRSLSKEPEGNGFVKSFHKAKESAMKFVGVFTAVIATFKAGYEVGKKLRETFLEVFSSSYQQSKKMERACADINKELKEMADRSVQNASDKYEKLSESIAKVNAERQRQNQLLKDELKYSRDASDAQAQLAKQKELALVSPGDDAGKAAVEAKYATMSDMNAAARRKADAVLKRQELDATARDSRDAANKIDDQVAVAQKDLDRLLATAKIFAEFSKERNEADGTWYNSRKRTEEGDKIREEQKKKSDSARSEAEKLAAKIDKMKKEADKLRANADAADASKDALWKEIETAEVMMKTAAVKSANVRKEAEFKAESEIAKAKKASDEKSAKERADNERKKMKKVAEAETEDLKRMHEERMKQLDAEAKKTNDNISRLLARGADNPMARAGGGNWQAEGFAADAQDFKDNVKIANAGIDAMAKIRKRGGTLDNPGSLRGLSNIERAALEKLQLDKQRKEAERIAKEKDLADQQMRANIKKIADQLEGVGL